MDGRPRRRPRPGADGHRRRCRPPLARAPRRPRPVGRRARRRAGGRPGRGRRRGSRPAWPSASNAERASSMAYRPSPRHRTGRAAPDRCSPSARPRRSVALLDAGLQALHEVGWEGFSLRDVAGRAGVTHTTAYNYFTSKEHLVAEINWRLLEALPDPTCGPATPWRSASPRRCAPERAVLGGQRPRRRDPSPRWSRGSRHQAPARRHRQRVATPPRARGGAGSRPAARVGGAHAKNSGAMVQAGMGYFSFDEVVTQVASLLARWRWPIRADLRG